MASTKQVGNDGEDKAARYLESRGCTILARNFRTRRGEVDIIAEDRGAIVFTEVKTQPHGSPADIEQLINPGKQRRIIAVARRYLADNPRCRDRRVRFDVIIIDMPALGPVYHIEGAFTER